MASLLSGKLLTAFEDESDEEMKIQLVQSKRVKKVKIQCLQSKEDECKTIGRISDGIRPSKRCRH
jgi:hypothetical protein